MSDILPRHDVMDAVIKYGASNVNRAIDGDSAYMIITTQIGLRDAEIERLRADAERYRWLRRQHWDYGGLCVVLNGRQVPLGIQTASLDRLDDAIDAAMSGEKP
jgi:hypothetical protein